MDNDSSQISVYFDGACASCVRDRDNYCRLAGKSSQQVFWVDITGKEKELHALGIDPHQALTELHVKIENKNQPAIILRELDAYVVLMKRTYWLRPLAWIIVLPVVRPTLGRLYHHLVFKRLKKSQRI